ncbi:hypothetical protein F2Q70_00040635 [Brassica cretica]|uniref:Uncharacterized protein n=1 Tax=Brassica cretica TaxID=69181 RepID=A0A8S9K626_BRACR|nr:hypothetical protein F2Q70_00040635 [Brassica cretica]
MEKHCCRCLMLDHDEDKDCLIASKEREEINQEDKRKGTLPEPPQRTHDNRRAVDRSYRSQRSWDSDKGGHREHLKRTAPAQLRSHQSERQREGRSVETGCRLQTSSRSNER